MLFQNKCLFPINGQKLTFDDVSLAIGEKGTIGSRRTVDLSVSIKNLKLNLPIIGANMSTVMDSNSARYISLMGGIGIIHQNMSVEQQIDSVRKVKRFGTPLIDDPVCVDFTASIHDVISIFTEKSIGAVLVVKTLESKEIVGIITKRDIKATGGSDGKVVDFMTGIESLKYITSDSLDIDITESEKALLKARVEQLPIISSKGKVIGLFTSKGLDFYKKFPNSSRDINNRLVVGAAVGQNRNPLGKAEKLICEGVDLLVIDTAHGWTENFTKVIKEIRHSFPQVLIAAGNIDNGRAAIEFASIGVDILKVGIGPGGACKTRVQTGFGTPQISAIGEVKEALTQDGRFKNVKIIGDGGINKAGNLAKCLAAGASFGMIGSMFAGTDLAPGSLREINGRYYKDYRGMASEYEASLANSLNGRIADDQYGPIFDEGANDIIPYKGDGSFIKTIRLIHGGLASALSYCNSNNIDEFYEKSKFQIQTLNGANEGRPWAFNN